MSAVELIGEQGVHDMLAKYADPILTKRLQAATKAMTQVFKAPTQAEAARVSKRLARSVSVRSARTGRPATVLTFRPRVAFFRHFVVDGTKDHGPRKAKAIVFLAKDQGIVVTSRVRGVKANPIIDRVVSAFEAPAYEAFDASLAASETGSIDTGGES